MEMSPLLSIVIPTRNREFYCIQTVKGLLDYCGSNIEIIIQDNSDSHDIDNYINSLNDNRIVYNRVPKRINSVLNMNQAVELASGKYVTMIGDDDFVLPTLYAAVEIMEIEGYDCLSPRHYDAFLWDSHQSDREYGTYIRYPQKDKIITVDPLAELAQCLKRGLISYQSYNLPKLYHGVVKRERLKEIQERTGHTIGGLSPDIYLAVSLSFTVKSCAVCYYPLTIQGISPTSTAYAGMHGTHKGRLEDAPHLYERGEYHWNPLIPKVYSVETIWADSALCAIMENSKNPSEWVELFNQQYFDSVFYVNNYSLKSQFPYEFDVHSFNLIQGSRYLLGKYKSKFRSLLWRIHGREKYAHLLGWSGVMEVIKKKYPTFNN